MAVLKIAVLVSGRGSNLQALINATQEQGYPAQIACVISNKHDVQALDRANAAHIPAIVINHRDFQTREEFEKVLDAKLVEHDVQLVCLAGFMRILTSWFVERWRDKLINIHPSLLPAFPGLNTHQKAIDYGVKFSGCTVHFVRSELDHGPIIIQAAVPILYDDTADTLAARILEAEYQIYPQAVRFIAENRVNIFGNITFIGEVVAPDSVINPLDKSPLAKNVMTQ